MSANPNYIHGHHESVLRSHSWRTAQNSAAYLLKFIKHGMHILDVGCGPGTITVDFAALVPQGKVIGLEYSPNVLDQARRHASERGVTNIEFTTGNILALDYPDNTFDIVHAHQVLQHVPDPVQALKEMRRVTKPGGFVANREADFAAMAWFPESDALMEWRERYVKVARSCGGEPNAGRRVVHWALQAGFSRPQINATAGTWCYTSPDERTWWSGMWADRTVSSEYAKKAMDAGVAEMADLESIAAAWREWGKKEDGWFVLLHGEIVCQV